MRAAGAAPWARGQHFLRSARLAEQVVRDAGIGPGDLVLDVGAGFGRLTAPLLATGARVIAVERDSKLARGLERRFPAARVVCGDALVVPLPRQPFRVVANLPFGISSAFTRRLLSSRGLVRADLIVARGFAIKWSDRHANVQIARRLPRHLFTPPPNVDAALIVVRGTQAGGQVWWVGHQ